ncbi:hypothetical protein [Rhodalgimonas zhirmunskyi]|uniref:Uncharacterized protein n=1 Tax=Rhodalgimonas zhirmunskyi TaxID=2964767 RepID=A0AAJ1X860_9RHOB|nr:hypothetical protein [Rhodoalgimonas zhirmunskyi]MDQ2095272.1 hypothetical protein [Rhodoalgimonas zhirmunskyi]
MSWFGKLFGFEEDGPDTVRRHIVQEGPWIKSRANGRRMRAGRLTFETVGQMRARLGCVARPGRIKVSEVVADVRELHADANNAGAVFQVASQFNLLEMISPEVSPEAGITGYANDLTQGPACAMACAAGTLYRAYLAPVSGQQGQSAERQLDGLQALGAHLDQRGRYWDMVNGYALATEAGLSEIDQRLARGQGAVLRDLIRVGVQEDTEVTLVASPGHLVRQVYCSAMPVAYSEQPAEAWEGFARLALEAAYEATFLAALEAEGPLYLTLLGGGAFGNREEWIIDAIERALWLFAKRALDVRVVSHGGSNPAVTGLVERWES